MLQDIPNSPVPQKTFYHSLMNLLLIHFFIWVSMNIIFYKKYLQVVLTLTQHLAGFYMPNSYFLSSDALQRYSGNLCTCFPLDLYRTFHKSITLVLKILLKTAILFTLFYLVKYFLFIQLLIKHICSEGLLYSLTMISYSSRHFSYEIILYIYLFYCSSPLQKGSQKSQTQLSN